MSGAAARPPASDGTTVDGLTRRIVRYADLLGPSGQEDRVVTSVCDDLSALGLAPDVDAFANVVAFLGPRDPGRPTLQLSAHLDEVGFVVRDVLRSGFLRVHRVGGVHDQVVAGQWLVFLGEKGDVPGVVGVRAKHACSPEELRRAVGVDDAFVDIGARDREHALELGIEIGTLGVFDARARVHGDRVIGKALDNRVGVAVLVELAERLRGADLAANVALLFTSQEEFAVRGGLSAARRVDADFAVCIDIAVATDVPVGDTESPVALGAGPVLTRFTRGSANGMIPSPLLRRFAAASAEQIGVRLQQSVLQGGLSDGAFTQHVGRGVPTLDASFATRYTHTPVETVDLRDVRGLVDWLDAMARSTVPDLRRG